MTRRWQLVAAVLAACLAACSLPGESGRAPIVMAAVGKVVDGIAGEITQRQANDAFRGLAVVVRTGSDSGTDSVISEMLRTRLTERGVAVEVACPSKCLEVNLVEFISDASSQAVPGQVLPVNAGTIAGLTGLPRPTSPQTTLASGQASALLVTFAVRDGNRYNVRQQVVAVVAVAKTPDSAR